MDRRFAPIAVAMLALGAAIGLFVSVDRLHGASPPVRAASPTPTAGSGAREPRRDDPLSQLDARIEAGVRAAERRDDDWLAWQQVATRYVERARLSGDYADYRRAEEALERAFEIAPAGSGPLLARASLHYTLHRLDRAEADLDAADRQAVVMPDDRATIRSLRADIAYHRGDLATARRLYEEQLASERTLANLVALAQLEWKTADFVRAEALLEEALDAARGPGERAWARLVRATMEREHGRHEAALAGCQTGLDELTAELRVADSHLTICVADARAALGDVERARASYESLLERSEDPSVLDRLARLARDRGDRDQMIAWRDRARALYEEQLAALPEAAYGHALDHFLELEEDAARIVELAERNRDQRPGGEAQTKLAQAYLRAGRAEDARAVIDALLEGEWSTAEAHATASLAHERLGDLGRAENERERAEAIAPGIMERLDCIRTDSL